VTADRYRRNAGIEVGLDLGAINGWLRLERRVG
jgi:hypothetical protein